MNELPSKAEGFGSDALYRSGIQSVRDRDISAHALFSIGAAYARQKDNNTLREQAFFYLGIAHQMAPDDPRIGLELAKQCFARERYRLASKVIAPFLLEENKPYDLFNFILSLSKKIRPDEFMSRDPNKPVFSFFDYTREASDREVLSVFIGTFERDRNDFLQTYEQHNKYHGITLSVSIISAPRCFRWVTGVRGLRR